MKVKRDTLLLPACLVWGAAGFNILRIGLAAYPAFRTALNFCLSALVFALFQRFVFGPLVKKHTARIRAYREERHFFLKFFDAKAFAVMAVMMTGGIALRADAVPLVGMLMIRGSKGEAQFRLFGWMAVVLGAGDSFHLVPRALALCTTGLENYTVALGLGKWITSVTMAVFYVLLYYVWRRRYKVQGQSGLTAAVYVLAGVRVLLCMLPQNQWLSADAPLSWGIYRNIPFALLGLVVIVLFFSSAKKHNDRAFRWMWLTIVLSFGFYIPVVLWADAVPLVGMLMIPKTCAYVWTVLIGYSAMKKEVK